MEVVLKECQIVENQDKGEDARRRKVCVKCNEYTVLNLVKEIYGNNRKQISIEF